jgi:hypothetical protein
VVVPGLANKVMVEGLRLIPRAVAASLAGRAHEPAAGDDGPPDGSAR